MQDNVNGYSDAVGFLFGLQKFGIKLGLSNITGILEAWGEPHRAYPVVHLAGTNGKGSTSAFLASVLTEAGYRTGLYTSPHLYEFTERIRIDGIPVEFDTVARYAAELKPEIEGRRATFFEAATAMAFKHFQEGGADIAVIETGLGGRLDATNVVLPELSVITGIAMEHTEHLGASLEEIAREKAGIVKPGIPILVGILAETALNEIRAAACSKGSPLFFDTGPEEAPRFLDVEDMRFVRETFSRRQEFHSPLAGYHQSLNASLALASAEILAERGFRIDLQAAVRGIAAVKSRTGIAGRLERISSKPETVIDAAHNPDGVRALLRTWLRLRAAENTHLVFGLLKSKDLDAVLDAVGTAEWASISSVDADMEELTKAEEIAARAACRGLEIKASGNVRSCMERKRAEAGESESILLFGSHYILGEFRPRDKNFSI